MILEINDIPIEVIRKPIKSINLRIYPPDGQVKVTVPLRCRTEYIAKFLQEKSDWITRQRQRIQTQNSAQDTVLQTGSRVLFKGEYYLLIIEEHHGPRHVAHHEGFIYCHIHPNPTPSEILNTLECWYKKEMSAIIPALIIYWQSIIGVQVNEWGIKKMKTRWGSCNTRAHRIWLNLNLIKKNPICLEYVLVHELVHLLEASHNKRFYALMDQFMPQWKKYDHVLEGKTLKSDHIDS